ncbi:predicted protein [Nematostella vectensis]|uniref:TGF-beta family profile domain-containing protein n=4 Tax=Nematostella vectensis TaxID=45351 RepID=A7RQJ0_NEMVE|nr:predicted protein [Nematostella vectensis]|eukprot:XP_001638358.1 predicted protein [Nematostella vectensis]
MHATYKFKLLTPEGERVTATEFRLYKEDTRGDPSNWRNATYVVRLYQVIYPAQVLDLIDQRVLRSWEKGWQEFDISAAGRVWSESPEKNYGLELSVVNFNNQELSPHLAGFVGFHGLKEKRPFIVSFFKQDGEKKYTHEIHAHDIRQHRATRVSRSLPNAQVGGVDPRASNKKVCQRQALHVSFRKLRWQDWVIAPEGYSAFYCSGECSFPLNANMNATNHAIVQTLVHLMNPKTVPKPCCAPTELSPISVLYFDQDNNVVLKKYNKMVVKACGCH